MMKKSILFFILTVSYCLLHPMDRFGNVDELLFKMYYAQKYGDFDDSLPTNNSTNKKKRKRNDKGNAKCIPTKRDTTFKHFSKCDLCNKPLHSNIDLAALQNTLKEHQTKACIKRISIDDFNNKKESIKEKLAMEYPCQEVFTYPCPCGAKLYSQISKNVLIRDIERHVSKSCSRMTIDQFNEKYSAIVSNIKTNKVNLDLKKLKKFTFKCFCGKRLFNNKSKTNFMCSIGNHLTNKSVCSHSMTKDKFTEKFSTIMNRIIDNDIKNLK